MNLKPSSAWTLPVALVSAYVAKRNDSALRNSDSDEELVLNFQVSAQATVERLG